MRCSITIINALYATPFSRPGYITPRQCSGHRWRMVASFPQLCCSLAVACLCLLFALDGLAQQAVSPRGDAFFEVLCTFGDDCCSVEAVSADGSIVAGRSMMISFPGEACIWEEGSGPIGIGVLPDGTDFTAAAVSADGTVVAGFGGVTGTHGTRDVAFRWEDGEMEDLGTLTGTDISSSNAFGVSADGFVVVGGGGGANGLEAFIWTETTGMVGLGHLHPIGNNGSSASGVSADGTVVVGRSQSDPMLEETFRWRADTGEMEGLGSISGVGSSRAAAVSADGAVVVGQSGSQAFRWTEQGGMAGLGFLPGGHDISMATAVSGDGSVVVGQASTAGGNRAFIWTQSMGMRALKEALEADYGLDLEGWTLNRPRGMSPDGAYIVGNGSDSNGVTIWWRVFRGGLSPPLR